MISVWMNDEKQILSGNKIRNIPESWSHLYIRKSAYDKQQQVIEKLVEHVEFIKEFYEKDLSVSNIRSSDFIISICDQALTEAREMMK